VAAYFCRDNAARISDEWERSFSPMMKVMIA
jgi:hypothetical protein